MTDKTKRIILIAAGVLLCAVLVVGDRQPPCGGAHAHRPRHPGRYTQHERPGGEHQRSRGKGG